MTFLLANWRLLIVGSLLLVLGIQTWRLDSCKKGWHDYEVSVQALAKAQDAENKRIANSRKELENETTAAKDKAIADLSIRYADARKRLRDYRPGSVSAPGEAPALASACVPSNPVIGGVGEDQEKVSSRLADVEAALLDALERADQELINYRKLWEWAQKVR